MESGETISLRCRVMKNLPQCSYQNIVALKKKHKYLQDVPLKNTEARRVGLIIGRDRTDLLEMEDKVIGKEGEPKAYKFKLGWAVMVPKKQQGTVEMLTTLFWARNLYIYFTEFHSFKMKVSQRSI